MLAFEVSLNGGVLYVAGFSEGISLATRIEARKYIPMDKGAYLITAIPSSPDGPDGALTWGGGQRKLAPGDTVTVRILEVDEADEPEPMGGDLRARGRFFVRRRSG